MSAYGSQDEFDWQAHWKGIVKGTFQPPATRITWESLYAAYTESKRQVMGPVEFQVSMADLLDRLPIMSATQVWNETNSGGYNRANTGEFQ